MHKVRLLGVDREHAAAVNCVSERVAHEMAAGARRLFAADLAIATTGYAEPCPEHAVAIPFAFVAIDVCGAIHTERLQIENASRVAVQRRVAEHALELLARRLAQ